MHETMRDWQVIGLPEPTDDLAAIKRSYAARLKVTRPDDDAQAYQALREAYDRMVAWARHQQALRAAGAVAVEPRPAGEAPAEPVAAVETPASAPAAVPVEAPAADHLSPEALCELVARTAPQGPAALEALVPVLRRHLNDLPLDQGAEASARFADLVLHTRLLPASLQTMLQAHFRWLDDFRTDRQIGWERTHALQVALDGLHRPVTDEHTLRLHADLVTLQALLARGRGAWALALATLMGVPLERQIQAAGPALMARLGFDRPLLERLATLLGRGRWLRMAAAGLLLFGLGGLLAHDLQGALQGMYFALAVVFVGRWLPLIAFGLVYGVRRRKLLPEAWAARLQWHRLHRWWPWVGVAALLAAAACFEAARRLDLAAPFIAGSGLLLLGIVLALPPVLEQALVAAGLAAYFVMALRTGNAALMLLVTAWVLGGMQLFLQRLWLPSPGDDAQRLNPLQALLTFTAGLPTIAASIAEHAGHRLVLTALLLALAPQVMGRQVPAWYALPLAVAALSALLFAQGRSVALARRLAPRALAGRGRPT